MVTQRRLYSEARKEYFPANGRNWGWRSGCREYLQTQGGGGRFSLRPPPGYVNEKEVAEYKFPLALQNKRSQSYPCKTLRCLCVRVCVCWWNGWWAFVARHNGSQRGWDDRRELKAQSSSPLRVRRAPVACSWTSVHCCYLLLLLLLHQESTAHSEAALLIKNWKCLSTDTVKLQYIAILQNYVK